MRVFSDFADLFDFYFAERDRLERIHQRAGDLLRIINNAISRTEKKLAIQRAALLESERAEEYKRAGDLITANLYLLKRGMTEISVVDYYDESCPTVSLTLDGRLTPVANAQRMYKLYNKAKTAKAVLSERIVQWEGDLLYLSSVQDFLMRAQTEQDLLDLRDELYRAGYASRMKGHQVQKQIKPRPIEDVTSGGYRVLIGRNNAENDMLTFKIASKGDLWFHVKDLPGSHVILFCDGEEPPEQDFTDAAEIAAAFSKGADGQNVEVDYTLVRNVKKPAGGKPGLVIYHTNWSCVVTPSAERVAQMRVK